MKMFATEENFHSLLSQFPMIILEYGELGQHVPIVMTKIGDAIDMRWAYRADPLLHRFMQETKWIKVLEARHEFAHLEKETVTALKGAVLADMSGDLHRSHHLRKKAHNFQIAKPPPFLVGLEDNSSPIHKPYFDLLIGLEKEITELNKKLQKLSRDSNRDWYETLAKEMEKKISRFEGIIGGVVAKLIPKEMWFEPLTQFFRRVDPIMMGCDDCFDPLNIVPTEWEVPATIINWLHMTVLLLHWLHASFVPRVQPGPPQFMAGMVQSHDVPTLVFHSYSSEWNLCVTADQISPLLNPPSRGSMLLSTLSRKRPREENF